MITFNCTSVTAASVIGLMVASVATAAPKDGWRVPTTETGGAKSAPYHSPNLDVGWRETLYLLASPANAVILRATAADRESDIFMSIDEVWAHFGVPKE